MQDKIIVFPEPPPDDNVHLVTPSLPVSLTSLIGREQEAQALHALLFSRSRRAPAHPHRHSWRWEKRAWRSRSLRIWCMTLRMACTWSPWLPSAILPSSSRP